MATIPANMRNVLIDAINEGYLNIRLEQTSSGTDHGALAALDHDDHPQYHNDARGDARYYTEGEVDTISGTLQDNIDAVLPNLIQNIIGIAYPAGVADLPQGASTVVITFPQPLDDPGYDIIMSMENTVDLTPSTYTYLVSAKDAYGFTVRLSAQTDTANYKMNWITGPVSSLLATPDHAQLDNLDYSVAGHTGFASTVSLDTVSGVLQTEIDGKVDPEDVGALVSAGLDWGDIITTPGTWKGETLNVIVDDASSVFGSILTQSSDFHYDRSDADFSAQSPGYVLALEAGAGTKKVLLYGQVCTGTWNAGKVYLSLTTGGMSQTVVSGSTDQIQVLGWAVASGTVFFNPNYMVAEVA